MQTNMCLESSTSTYVYSNYPQKFLQSICKIMIRNEFLMKVPEGKLFLHKFHRVRKAFEMREKMIEFRFPLTCSLKLSSDL